MADIQQQILDNVSRVRDRIADAAKRVGRQPTEITLVAVSKYVDTDVVDALIAAGCHDLGESRPQELWRKSAILEDRDISAGVRWHMIGHLQRNKVRRTLPLIRWLHACDSMRLLHEVNRVAADLEQPTDVLLEVNISGEVAKHGFGATELAPLLPEIAECRDVRIRGLMAMAGLAGGAEAARRDFSALRELRDVLGTQCPDNVSMGELSMGMSRDFETAIEEGATMVRVGSTLFEGIDR